VTGRLLAVGAVTLALTAAAAGLTLAAGDTTRPGVLYFVNVTLTDGKIILTHKSHTSLIRLPRGAYIRYVVKNKGTRTYVFQIWETRTAPIKPGRRDSVVVNWNYRGRFAYMILFRGKPAGPRSYITIY